MGFQEGLRRLRQAVEGDRLLMSVGMGRRKAAKEQQGRKKQFFHVFHKIRFFKLSNNHPKLPAALLFPPGDQLHDREIEQRSSPQGDADHGRCDRHDPLGGGLPSAVLLRRVRLRPVHRVGCDRFSFRACSRSGRFSFLSLFCSL